VDFVNHTSFPAQDFGGIDQHDQAFHVIALRQTLQWSEGAVLRYMAQQVPLCESDAFWGAANASSMRQESDYCQYKPKCDVIVNAIAHAPGGVAMPSYLVRLQVRGPDKVSAPQPRPRGLNPFMAASLEALAQWHAQLEAGPVHGEVLIDKTLEVTGPRWFERKGMLARLAATAAALSTLGGYRPPAWRLTRPQPLLTLPLRAEYAFGGECSIDATDAAARRVPVAHQLTAAQAQACALVDEPLGRRTIASACFEPNPFGQGFAQRWFLKATGARQVAAPQISLTSGPVTARDFCTCLDGPTRTAFSARLSTGLGVRPKSHPQRRRLAGTIDDAFAQSQRWLPDDFDFAVWNSAEPDQQTDFMKGGEVIELTNLCAPGAPGSRRDAAGNTMLTLTLPTNECYALVRLDSGEMFATPMAIDTVIVEPEERQVALVWRLILARTEEAQVRAVEVMSRSHEERDAMRRQIDTIKAAVQTPGAEVMHG
jgi:hypothetical protein